MRKCLPHVSRRKRNQGREWAFLRNCRRARWDHNGLTRPLLPWRFHTSRSCKIYNSSFFLERWRTRHALASPACTQHIRSQRRWRWTRCPTPFANAGVMLCQHWLPTHFFFSHSFFVTYTLIFLRITYTSENYTSSCGIGGLSRQGDPKGQAVGLRPPTVNLLTLKK